MDLIIDGLISRKTGDKYHDFVLDDAISSIKRANEAIEEGLKDPEQWWTESLIQAKTIATMFPFIYLVQQRLSHNLPHMAEESSQGEREEDPKVEDTFESE
jgi:hypothetical protein